MTRRWTYDGDEGEDAEEDYENEDYEETPPSDENPKVSSETIQNIKQRIEADIDNFIRSMGISNPEIYTHEGWRYIRCGSAQIFTGVTIDNEIPSLRAYAKIMDLPSDKDLILPLMRELLELNLIIPNDSRFAIHNNAVVVVVNKIITEYGEQMVSICLQLISTTADEWDDYLIQKYGGTSKKRN